MAKKSLSGIDLRAPLLANGSTGASGQVLASQGPGVTPIWITSSAPASSIVLGIVYGSTSNVYGSNVSLGYQSLNSSTGSGNVAVGYQALFTNSSGSYNSAFGSYSLLSNTSGSQNSAFGSNALEANTTGSSNTAIGNGSLGLNTVGYNNIAIGDGALSSNTSAVSNIAIGVSALNSKVAGNYNTVIGQSSLNNNTSGSNNVTLGANTLPLNLTGSRNTAIGTSAGYSQTGSDNISIGYEAGYNETGSGKLYISNSNTADPLIYGNFYSSQLKINGGLQVTGTTDLTSSTSIGSVSSTEIGYLDGVTSNIQSQIETKASLTGVETLTNKTLASPNFTGSAQELVTVVGTGFAGYTFDAATQAVVYITAASTANGTLNIRGNVSTTLNTFMAVGEAITVVLAVTNGATAYYPTAYQIDGIAITPKWVGTAPAAGNASAIDSYTLTIIKTAATPTYVVLASQTKFA